MKHYKLRFLGIIIAYIMMMIFIIVMVFSVSPYPLTMAMRSVFSKSHYEYQNVDELYEQTEIKRDVIYDGVNRLDILKHKTKEVGSTILWIHGGAFVGGDKKDVEPYMMKLANEGYTVVNLNYDLAPENPFPKQLINIDQAIKFLEQNQEQYQVALQNIIVGGDSAGAALAAAWMIKETNESYQETLSLNKVLSEEQNIQAAILFCGPYDFQRITKEDHIIKKFLFRRIGWAYTGKYQYDPELILRLTLKEHVTEDFPKTFIVDANQRGAVFDFLDHQVGFIESLTKKGVSVHGVVDSDLLNIETIQTYQEFFNGNLTLGHNFQFHTAREENIAGHAINPGLMIYQALVTFLENK